MVRWQASFWRRPTGRAVLDLTAVIQEAILYNMIFSQVHGGNMVASLEALKKFIM
jgi:hypothetical protein